MRRFLLPALLIALLAPAVATLADAQVTRIIIRERMVIRLPRLSPDPVVAPMPAPIRWREKKGPACVPVGRMAGAMIVSPRQVDLVLIGGQRVRAVLDGACQPLDFYSGFYIRPNSDGLACAGRDTIRIRSGASCDIAKFRTLVARK